MRRRRWLMAGLGPAGTAQLAAAVLCLGSGCADLGYYKQSVTGHMESMSRVKPVDTWLADANTSAALKQRLASSFDIDAVDTPDGGPAQEEWPSP